MAYGNFFKKDGEAVAEYVYDESNRKATPSKLLAKSFLYMFIGLVITGVVGFLIAYAFARGIGNARNSFDSAGKLTQIGWIYIGVMIGSFVALLIDSFAMNIILAKGKHTIWIPFIIWCTLMGVLLSSFVLIVDFWTIAEALGISAGVFLIMFLVGYFSKVDLNPLGLVAIGVLFMLMFFGLFWGIFAAINRDVMGLYIFDLVFTLVFGAVMMLIVAIDAYNIKRILGSAQQASENLALYCAFTLYNDFIIILVRVLYLLILIKGRN